MILRPGNPMRSVLLALLGFEAVVFALAIPVMILVSEVPGGVAAGLGVAAAGLAVAAAALLRRTAGYLLGWLTQVVGLLLGAATPAMFAAGGLFAALWVITFVLGRRLEEGTASPGGR